MSSSRNSVSGRIEAAAIAFSTEFVSAGPPRIFATCNFAAGVRSSAAITATISWPSANQAQAGWANSIAPKTVNRKVLDLFQPSTLPRLHRKYHSSRSKIRLPISRSWVSRAESIARKTPGSSAPLGRSFPWAPDRGEVFNAIRAMSGAYVGPARLPSN